MHVYMYTISRVTAVARAPSLSSGAGAGDGAGGGAGAAPMPRCTIKRRLPTTLVRGFQGYWLKDIAKGSQSS